MKEQQYSQARTCKQEPGVFLWAAYNQPIDSDPSPSPLKYSKGLLEKMAKNGEVFNCTSTSKKYQKDRSYGRKMKEI